MSKIGRNQPCPCGSGRKYKKCCLGSERGGYSRADRKAALVGLHAFLSQPALRADFREAFDEYWGPWDPEDIQDDDILLMCVDGLDSWFMFDCPVVNDLRVVDLYLRSQPDLPAGQRRYLQAMRETTVHLYEVTHVHPDVSLGLRDLMSGDHIEVRERLASRSLQRWDVVATRILPIGASGAPEMERGALALPRGRVHELLDIMREERTGYPDSEAGERAFYESLPPLLNQYWLAPIIEPQLPELCNFDGDPLILTESLFEIVDRSRLCTIFDQAGALERQPDADAWNWPGRGRQRDEDISLGRVEIRGERLVLETNSRERAERGRSLLEGLAGDALRYVMMTMRDPRQAFLDNDSEREPPTDTSQLAGMTEVLQKIKDEYYHKYYRAWLDDSIPMLDGKTPREAARSDDLRPRLVDILKDLEQMYERSLASGQPGFDPSWMWVELGLENELDAPRSPPPIMGHESKNSTG